MGKVAKPGRSANAERGEIALELDGQSFVLRPSFEAIEAFEGSTGKGLIQLTREAIDGTLRASEVAQIATACIRAGGRATGDSSAAGVNPQRVAELLLEGEGGLAEAMVVLAGVLAMASTGGYMASGEAKAGTRTSALPADNSQA